MVRWLVLAAVPIGCGDPAPYQCHIDLQCKLAGVQGTCTQYDFCAFDDPSCPSGLRYHESAGDLAGICVGDEPGPPRLIQGDTADNPLVLQPMQQIDIANAQDDFTPSCGGSGGRDVFFEIQIAAPGRLYIDTLGSNFNAVLVVAQGACSSSPLNNLACVSGACPQFDQWSDIVSAGTFCVIVDQDGSSGGTQLVLRSMLGPPAELVDFGNLTGTTCGGDYSWQGACATGPSLTWFTTTCMTQSAYLQSCGVPPPELEVFGFGKSSLGCADGCQGIDVTIPPGPAWLVAADAPNSCSSVSVGFRPN